MENQIKQIFSLTKNEIMFIVIGIAIVLVLLCKIYPLLKKVLVIRKDFYEKIDKRFDDIEVGIAKMEKGFNIIYEILLNNMIDEYKGKKKSHFADEKFARLMNKYNEYGDGNSISIQNQWNAIEFE